MDLNSLTKTYDLCVQEAPRTLLTHPEEHHEALKLALLKLAGGGGVPHPLSHSYMQSILCSAADRLPEKDVEFLGGSDGEVVFGGERGLRKFHRVDFI